MGPARRSFFLTLPVLFFSSCRPSAAPPPDPQALIPDEQIVSLSSETAAGLLRERHTPATVEALFDRIRAKDARTVQVLLQANLSPDAVSSAGEPALTAAVRAEATGAITALLRAGANVNAGGDNAPLFVAIDLNRVEIARRLATFSGFPGGLMGKNKIDFRPMTPPIDTHAVNREGRTALTVAVNDGRVDIVQILLDAGWDVATEDTERTSPLDRAFRRSDGNLVRRLVEYGAPLNRRDADGLTPLARAATYGAAVTTIEMMLERGAAIDARDAEGRAPLDLARRNNHAEIAALLEKRGAHAGAGN